MFDVGDPLPLSRTIFIRRHGDGFMVTVEPHPSGHSLNRRFADHGAAQRWARGSEKRKGWPVQDMAAGSTIVSDPVRRLGCPRVRLDQKADQWSVSISNRPWGWPDPSKTFFCPAEAARYADELRSAVTRHLAANAAWRRR